MGAWEICKLLLLFFNCNTYMKSLNKSYDLQTVTVLFRGVQKAYLHDYLIQIKNVD